MVTQMVIRSICTSSHGKFSEQLNSEGSELLELGLLIGVMGPRTKHRRTEHCIFFSGVRDITMCTECLEIGFGMLKALGQVWHALV